MVPDTWQYIRPFINACNARKAHVQIAHEESAYSSTGDRSNCDCCNIPSTPDLHDGKNLGHHDYSNPSPDHNNVSGTNGLPKGATTIHSRRKDPHQHQEQRKHLGHQARLLQLEASQPLWVVAKQLQFLHLPLPSLAQGLQTSPPKALFQKVTFSLYYLLSTISILAIQLLRFCESSIKINSCPPSTADPFLWPFDVHLRK